MKPIHALGGALALALPACVPQPKSSPPVQTRPVATPRPTPAPAPPPAPVNWMDAPQTPGDWSYSKLGDGSLASFGEANNEPRFALRCATRTRQVELMRYMPDQTRPATMVIRTETQSRSLTAAPSTDGSALVSSISANDRLLDAMALSKGRFAVEVPGTPPLYLPSWAEVTRVIEDCR